MVHWKSKIQFWKNCRILSSKIKFFSALSPEMSFKKYILRGLFLCSSKRLFVQVEKKFHNRAVIFQPKIRVFLRKNPWKTQTVTYFRKKLFSLKRTSGCVECHHLDKKLCSKIKRISNLSPRMILGNVFFWRKLFFYRKIPWTHGMQFWHTCEKFLPNFKHLTLEFQHWYKKNFLSRSLFPSKRSSLYVELISRYSLRLKKCKRKEKENF